MDEDDTAAGEGPVSVEPGPDGLGKMDAGPVGEGDYVVRQGECISSIAAKKGFRTTTIWDDPANEELRKARKDPNVLLPGDRVTIPAIRRRHESVETDKRHRFAVKTERAFLVVRVMDEEDRPRAGEPCTVHVDGMEQKLQTDEDGQLKIPIAPGAKRGRIFVGKERQEYPFTLGRLDPITETTGVQSRLKNLGYYAGMIDGNCGPETHRAIQLFQMQQQDLAATGEPDQATRERLMQAYGR